jgi:hypothetical protein
VTSFNFNGLLTNRNLAANIAACALLICTVAVVSLKTQAAPITFAFDATVTDVPADFPALNLPFSLSPGQKFSGEYSFASAQDTHDVFFPSYPDGLGKSGTVTVTIDNVVGTAFVNMGELNDGALANPPDPSTPTFLYLSYDSPTNVVPPWRGGIANNRLNTTLLLRGPNGSFVSESDLFDPNAWNHLMSQREFDLQFVYFAGTNLNYVTVKSEVGDFRAVPEPATIHLSSLGVAFCLISGFSARPKRVDVDLITMAKR